MASGRPSPVPGKQDFRSPQPAKTTPELGTDAPANGRLRSVGERDGDRIILVLCQLWPFLGLVTGTLPLLWIGVLVVWAVRKEASSLIDDQGREICNTLITLLILLLVPVIGWAVALVWIPVWLVNTIRAAMANGRAEYFRFPMTVRLLR